RRRSARLVVAFAIGWGLAIGPWLAKNIVDTGNPVYPLAYQVFDGRYWNADRDAKWTAGHGSALQGYLPVTSEALRESIIDVAGRWDWQSALYVALGPFVVVRKGSRRVGWVLWGYVLYIFTTWWLLRTGWTGSGCRFCQRPQSWLGWAPTGFEAAHGARS